MTQSSRSSSALRVADLAQNSATAFVLRPETARLKDIAAELELLGLRKLSFVGEITADGKHDWRLRARLGATVIQPCSVTLDPVTTRIDAPVSRLYQHDYIEDDLPEVEMPEDETIEPLSAWIDPEDVMMEALVLHLPLYPRAGDVELGELVVTEPGVAPMRDEDARPFAGLAALKQELEGGQDDDEDTS